jgi:hypothetical protein
MSQKQKMLILFFIFKIKINFSEECEKKSVLLALVVSSTVILLLFAT